MKKLLLFINKVCVEILNLLQITEKLIQPKPDCALEGNEIFANQHCNKEIIILV